MSDLHSRKNIAPYMYVSADAIKELSDGRKFRVIIYGAYNALGLIGTECNGIAILNEIERDVVADEVLKANSGYDTPTLLQKKAFNTLINATDAKFIEYVNTRERLRYSI